jgi:alkylhydroperoxidase family enzyme
MTHSLDQLDWCPVPLVEARPDPEWERDVAQRGAQCTSLAPFLTPLRWMLIADEILEARVTPHVPLNLGFLIGLVVAMDNSCRHCYGAFRSVLRIMGYPERAIRKLEESLALGELSAREKVALEFARKVARSMPRPAREEIDQLQQAGYSPLEIAEIVYLAGMAAAGNRLATMLAVPPHPLERASKTWLGRVSLPFIRGRLRRGISALRPTEPARAFDGLGAKIVHALEGSPAATALSAILSDAWRSEVTTPRLKALCLAVIARGLQCPACEAEATAVLTTHDLSAEDTDRLLTHLASERLSAFELAVLRFARETVRYQTRRLQRITQEFARGLSREQLLEVIGLTSYFNGLVRMSILLDRC